MTPIKLEKYGPVLTGREFGKDVCKILMQEIVLLKKPYSLDCAEILSIGSSFGDEVIPKIAALQGNKIQILNANKPVQNCIAKVARDAKIDVVFD